MKKTEIKTIIISLGGSLVVPEEVDVAFVRDFKKIIESKIKDAGGTLQGETKTKILGMEFTGGMAHLVTGLQWSLFVVGAIQIVGRLFGASDNLVNSLSIAAFAGIMSWKGILAGLEYTGTKMSWLSNSAGFIGIGVAAIVFIMLYKESEQKVVTYECLPWEAPSGGKSCEKCNADPFKPCTEYRCKALGQACQLLNPGTGFIDIQRLFSNRFIGIEYDIKKQLKTVKKFKLLLVYPWAKSQIQLSIHISLAPFLKSCNSCNYFAGKNIPSFINKFSVFCDI